MKYLATPRWALALITLLTSMAMSKLGAVEGGYELRYSYQQANPRLQAEARPFHSGLIKINPHLDQLKPLAEADYAGVAYESGILVGAFNEDWIGAFHLSNDQALWWIAAKGGLTAPPAVFGSWVILALRDGQVMKLNLLTGKKLWSVKLDSFVARSFAKMGSNLLAVTAAQSLYNLDFETGASRWIYDGGFPDKLAIRHTSAPTIHEQRVYYGLSSGEVAALDLESGHLVWRHNPALTTSRFADVIGELIILGPKLLLQRYDGLITSLSLDNPKTPVAGWEEPKAVNTITTSTYRHGKLYVGTSNGYVYAFNAQTGQEIWHSLIGASLSSLTAGETQLYTSTSQGRITTLDISNGSILWQDNLAGQIVSPPVYIGPNLYFLTGNKVLYGYRLN